MKQWVIAILFFWGFHSSLTLAASADGYCVNGQGSKHSTYLYNFNFNKTISADNNKAGTELRDVFHGSSGDSYPGKCICTSDYKKDDFTGVYYTSKLAPGLIDTGRVTNQLRYFSIPGYHHLEVAAAVLIYGRGYLGVPFEYEKNTNAQKHQCDEDGVSGVDSTFNTGSEVSISFFVAQPFIGTTVIPTTDIIKIWASLSRNSPLYSEPLVTVRIGGTLTVPQNCEVNAGQVINVDFKDIAAQEFSATPGKAITSRKITKQVAIKCAQMVAGETIKGSLVANSASGNTQLIETSNPNVGIQVFDKNDKVVDVNHGDLPVDANPADKNGTVDGTLTFKSAPASVSGARPASGEFTATATINVEFTH